MIDTTTILAKRPKYSVGSYIHFDFNEKKIPCVMCGKRAVVIAPETKEALCYPCGKNNEEARDSRGTR